MKKAILILVILLLALYLSAQYEQHEVTVRNIEIPVNVFSEVEKATGGIVDNSQNPAASFKNASEMMEFCYLLYYSPIGYQPDGEFKKVTVELKNRDLRVSHRLGYFAR